MTYSLPITPGQPVKFASEEVNGEHIQEVVAANIHTKFREAFEVSPQDSEDWVVSIGAGDILVDDGNAIAASYAVISKSPWQAGNVTTIESAAAFDMPLKCAIGLAASNRVLGQELSVEIVSTEPPLPTPADLAIATISQAAGVLTVNTVEPHNLPIGARIGTRDVSDSRLNYPALVVATAPSATQFTVTAGPGGNLPSVTAGPFASGYVYQRSALGLAPDGTSMIFENTTATNASFYVRSASGDAEPSNVVAANHSVTVGTTAAVQAINAARTYAFQPTTEFQLVLQVDKLQWMDAGVDATTATTGRHNRTKVVPDPLRKYKVRLRATNNASLTRPVAKILSVVKTASATAVITTDVPHGLNAASQFAAYGVRDQTNFANLAVATAITAINSPTQFTATWGASVTATSYGGVIYKVEGGNLPSTCGAIAQVLQSVTRTGNILTLVGNASWSGLLIGNYIEIGGCYDTSGVYVPIDGAYRVQNIATTTLTLEPINSTVSPTGTDIVLTNVGGAVIKRTDWMASFVRVLDFSRLIAESLARPQGDLSGATSVNVQNSVTIGALPATPAGTNSIGNIGTVTTAGTPPVPATPYFLNSAASTNGNLILTGTSGLQALFATNTGAAVAFVKLYNKATAPTVGTDVPEMIIPVPAAVAGVPGQAALPIGYSGFRFALGLGIAITGLVADTDTTAVAAGQVKVKLTRTV